LVGFHLGLDDLPKDVGLGPFYDNTKIFNVLLRSILGFLTDRPHLKTYALLLTVDNVVLLSPN
jgi:hypothetical protein